MKLYGILQDAQTGESLVKPSRNLKLSIGLPGQSPDIHVRIDPTGEWVIQAGSKTAKFKTRSEAQAAYPGLLRSCGTRKAPKKLPYFTVTRLSSDGGQEPEFGAIEALGPVPTSVELALFGRREEDVCEAAYQLWTKTELRCKGDGRDCERLVTLAAPNQKEAAEAAKAAGQRYFKIPGGCWAAAGCKYWKAEGGCKPHMSLRFQLAKYPVIGGVSGFDTTSFKSIRIVSAQVEQIFEQLGSVRGLKATLSMHPYKTKSGSAYYVRLNGAGVSSVVIPDPVVEEQSEAAQAAAFTGEFTDEPAEEFEEHTPEPEPEEDEPVDKPAQEPKPEPAQPAGPALTDEQRTEVYQLAKAKKMNKAKADTWLATLPKDAAYSAVLGELAKK